jgi:hypothetical protein
MTLSREYLDSIFLRYLAWCLTPAPSRSMQLLTGETDPLSRELSRDDFEKLLLSVLPTGRTQ